MSGRAFVDTNILLYAHDRGSGAKHEAAKALVRRLWRERTGVISTQVLQELYVNLRKVARKPLGQTEARALLEDYLTWEVVVNDGESVIEAVELESRFQLSFWDALIVQAATVLGGEFLDSEDVNHDQVEGTGVAANPNR